MAEFERPNRQNTPLLWFFIRNGGGSGQWLAVAAEVRSILPVDGAAEAVAQMRRVGQSGSRPSAVSSGTGFGGRQTGRVRLTQLPKLMVKG